MHGELDVLHVLVVTFEFFIDIHQLLVHRGHDLFHRGQLRAAAFACRFSDGLRRADACHHVFTLCVHQVFTVEDFLACRRVTREGNAGGAIITHVAEHHRLYVHRRTPFFRDIVHLAVGDRAVVHPRFEHGTHSTPQLVFHILWERFAGFFLHFFFIGIREFF